jgi:hypothetical protein
MHHIMNLVPCTMRLAPRYTAHRLIFIFSHHWVCMLMCALYSLFLPAADILCEYRSKPGEFLRNHPCRPRTHPTRYLSTSAILPKGQHTSRLIYFWICAHSSFIVEVFVVYCM